MKIDPGFTSHWKTRRLLAACGPEAVLGLLALWGDCQIRRRWQGLDLTPRKVAAIMRCDGDCEKLWAALTDPDCPWLDPEPDGTWTVHGFEEHQGRVISLWRNGSKGGRKPSPTPPPNTDSYSDSYTYPVDEPTRTKGEPKPTLRFASVSVPTVEEVVSEGQKRQIPRDVCERFFHACEERPLAPSGGWTLRNGQPMNMEKWQASLTNYASAVAENRRKDKHNGNHKHGAGGKDRIASYRGVGDPSAY